MTDTITSWMNGYLRAWDSNDPDDIRAESSDYSNLWVIRLEEDGRASEFTEWWMEKPPGLSG